MRVQHLWALETRDRRIGMLAILPGMKVHQMYEGYEYMYALDQT